MILMKMIHNQKKLLNYKIGMFILRLMLLIYQHVMKTLMADYTMSRQIMNSKSVKQLAGM